MFSQIVFLFALGCIAFANASSAPVGVVTCKASPQEVQIGENATVTCLFPFDISHKSVWMTVEYLPYNGPEYVELVDCLKHKTPNAECKVLQQGYAIEGDVKTSLKLRITNISAQQTGRFVCHMMLPKGEREAPETEMCSLSVRRVVTCKASSKQVEIRNDATVTCHFPYDVRQMSSVSVTVGHFPDDEPEREHAVELVECRKTNTPELECTGSKAYVIEGKVTTSLKLRIFNISAQHSGRFLCRMFPAEGVEIPISEMCSVSVLGECHVVRLEALCGNNMLPSVSLWLLANSRSLNPRSLVFPYTKAPHCSSPLIIGAVTCKVSSKQVEIGNNATVTCHFPYDVSQMSSVSVTVEHFPDNEPEREHAVELVECRKTNTPELECTESKAYVIEGNVTTSLKLSITNISAQHSGRFLCQMLPAEGVEIPISEMCSVSVLDVTPVPTTVPTNYETTADVENNGSNVEEETNIAPVIVVVLVVVAATAVIVVKLYRRRGQADADDETDNGSSYDGDTQTDNECDDVSEEDMENPFLPVNDKDNPVRGFGKQTSEQKDKGGFLGTKELQHQMISLSLQGPTVATLPQPSFIHPVVSSEDTVRLLLVGKTGTGKTGNTVLGQKLFRPSSGSVTRVCERRVGTCGNTRIEIMDSPGLFDTGRNDDKFYTTVIKAVAGMHLGPHAILYVIKLGCYTEEDHSAYLRFKAIFDNDVTKYVIIVLTHGDQLEQHGTTLAAALSSPTAPANVVLRECGNRYILFNNNSHNKPTQVDELLGMVRKMAAENGNRPYSCPKYSKFGEELEEEVSKRMAKYEKRELQTNTYHQLLKAETDRAEQKAAETWEEFKRKEAQREEEVRKVEERRKKLEEDLKNQQSLREDRIQKWQTLLDEQKQQIARLKIEEQERKKKSISKQRSNFKQELEKMEEKERQMQELVEQQRREDEQREETDRKKLTRLEQKKRGILEQHKQQQRAQMEEVDRINRELKEKMAKESKVQREQQRRAEIERQREMEELKNQLVEQEESVFFWDDNAE